MYTCMAPLHFFYGSLVVFLLYVSRLFDILRRIGFEVYRRYFTSLFQVSMDASHSVARVFVTLHS